MDDSSKPGYNAESQGGPANVEPQPTIVGGRPGVKGRGSAGIPVGIQVLVKKAVVDSEFRALLLQERSQAASRIGLELTPAEIATVNSVPKAQLEKIIAHTKVPDEHRRVFLGYLGAAMAALLLSATSTLAWKAQELQSRGILPDYPAPRGSMGIRPDHPGIREGYVPPPLEQPPHGLEADLGIRPDRPDGSVENPVFLRVKPEEERLSFTVLDEKPGSVTVEVTTDCPFEWGEITVFLRRDRDYLAFSRGQTSVIVVKGTGKAAFVLQGSGGTTEWALVQLINRAANCRNAPTQIAPDLDKLGQGEYRVGPCIIWHIAKYRKVWSGR